MDLQNFFDKLNGGARWDVGVAINRSNSLPLDANSVFASLEAAQNYAAGNPAEGTLANAYPGQVLAVVTDAETIIYYIDANMNLQPVGNTKEIMAYLGEIPETSDAKTIIEYINKKTEGIATDAALSELQKDVDALEVAVNGKAAVGEEGAEDYEPAVVGLVDEVADIKENYLPKTGGTVDYLNTGALTVLADDNRSVCVLPSYPYDGGSELTHTIDFTKSNYPDANDRLLLQVSPEFKGNATVTLPSKSGTLAVIDDVDAAVTAKIAEINHAVFEKVDAVPEVENAAPNVLYLVPNGDKMDIYAKIGEEMVLLDDTDTDLSGYALKSELHEHANKTVLDGITAEKVLAWDGAAEKTHEHENKTVLDAITAEKVAAWDKAEKNLFNYIDGNYFYIDVDEEGDEKLTFVDTFIEEFENKTSAIASVDTAQFAIVTDAEKNVDRQLTLLDVAQGKISGLTNKAGEAATLAEVLAEKVNAEEGKGLSTNDFTDTLLAKLNGIAAGAQVNVIEGITFNGVAVPVGEDKIADITYTLPIADADTLGGVKSSAAENKITVANDGTMEVASLNVNKLVQSPNEFLILNGGGASI